MFIVVLNEQYRSDTSHQFLITLFTRNMDLFILSKTKNHSKTMNPCIFIIYSLEKHVGQSNNRWFKFVYIFHGTKEFDKDQIFKRDFYLFDQIGCALLELCCFLGAIKCFKLLTSKFSPQINKKCLIYSFISGVPDIVNECLKYQKPDKSCMTTVINCHNIDFVSFLRNEYDIEIILIDCVHPHNLQALFAYLDITNDINGCFIYSPAFNIISLCKYLILHSADVNAGYMFRTTALLMDTQNNCNKKTLSISLLIMQMSKQLILEEKHHLFMQCKIKIKNWQSFLFLMVLMSILDSLASRLLFILLHWKILSKW